MKSPCLSLCLALAVTAAACDRTPMPADGSGGRFVLRREARGDLLDAPGRGVWCARDSSLAITAIASDGAAGVAVFTAWPIAVSESLAVGNASGARGAVVAWRPLTDSIHAAVTSDSGLLVLSGDSLLTGRADVRGTGADSSVTHLQATFERIPVTASCPETP